jgi:hypothetical protein
MWFSEYQGIITKADFISKNDLTRKDLRVPDARHSLDCNVSCNNRMTKEDFGQIYHSCIKRYFISSRTPLCFNVQAG